jgi:2-hydroxy-4-carboxymuconate semialdehyde hemiacetal dehydrogenase
MQGRRGVMADGLALGTGVAVLGYGAIADFHVEALARAGANVLVVAGPKPDQVLEFARRHGIPAVETDPARAIAADGVEAVVIASPSQVHPQQAQAALAAGRHVLVEIPLALSVPDAEALVAQASAAGTTLMVCHTLRYSRPMNAAREAMRTEGWRPTNVVARGLSRRHENVGWTGRRRSWTDDLLWHHGGHVVDAVLTFLDAPVAEVTAAVGPVWDRSGLPMDYAIALRTADGRVASISLSYNARIGTSDYVIIGPDQTIVIDGAEVRNADGPILTSESVAKAQEHAIWAQEADFLESIRTGRRPVADAAAILPAMRVLQAVWDRVG